MTDLPTINFNTAATGILNDGRIVMGTPHEVMVFDPGAV